MEQTFTPGSNPPRCPATAGNGFIGTGTDVLLSLVTLLIYTPHTLRVTCEQP